MTGNTPQVADWGRAEDATGSPPDRASQGTGMQPTPGARLRRLMNAIDSEVIPRLVLAHRDGDRLTPSPRSMKLAAQVDNLLALLLADQTDAVIAHLRSLRDEGSSVEAMYLDILAPKIGRAHV